MEEFSLDELKDEVSGKNNIEIVDMIIHGFTQYHNTFVESLKEKSNLSAVMYGETLVKYKSGFDTILKTIRLAFDSNSNDADIIKEYAHSTVAECFPTEKPHNDPNNAIKIDENQQMHKFGNAVRLTKDGKGRMDLVPEAPIDAVIRDVYEKYVAMGDLDDGQYVSREFIMKHAFQEDPIRKAYDIIEDLTIYIYAQDTKTLMDDSGTETTYIDHFDSFLRAFASMTLDLSKHYENGAKHYGIDNWKRGIPITGGIEGGSFNDSMTRHTLQLLTSIDGFMTDDNKFISLSGESHFPVGTLLFDRRDNQLYKYNPQDPDNMYVKEEPHHLAALWNAFGILWTVAQGNK